jgi:hypothetical protein
VFFHGTARQRTLLYKMCHLEMCKLATYTPPVDLVRRFKHMLCKCAVSGVSPRTAFLFPKQLEFKADKTRKFSASETRNFSNGWPDVVDILELWSIDDEWTILWHTELKAYLESNFLITLIVFSSCVDQTDKICKNFMKKKLILRKNSNFFVIDC